MVQPSLEEPTTRITINLFSRDIAYLKRLTRGSGYQVKIRDIVREYCKVQRMRRDDVVVMGFDD